MIGIGSGTGKVLMCEDDPDALLDVGVLCTEDAYNITSLRTLHRTSHRFSTRKTCTLHVVKKAWPKTDKSLNRSCDRKYFLEM